MIYPWNVSFYMKEINFIEQGFSTIYVTATYMDNLCRVWGTLNIPAFEGRLMDENKIIYVSINNLIPYSGRNHDDVFRLC